MVHTGQNLAKLSLLFPVLIIDADRIIYMSEFENTFASEHES